MSFKELFQKSKKVALPIIAVLAILMVLLWVVVVVLPGDTEYNWKVKTLSWFLGLGGLLIIGCLSYIGYKKGLKELTSFAKNKTDAMKESINQFKTKQLQKLQKAIDAGGVESSEVVALKAEMAATLARFSELENYIRDQAAAEKRLKFEFEQKYNALAANMGPEIGELVTILTEEEEKAPPSLSE